MMHLKTRFAALTTMSSAQLREEWVRHFDCDAPLLPDPLLQRMIGHRLQEKRHGSLPAMVIRELMRSGDEGGEPFKAAAIEIRPGTRFMREWHGRTISVEAVDGGFQWNERRYPSLSAIAREVTGAHWSGPRFFGVTSRAR
jgi:hypothetical protein